ncbi:MAG: hypothetical protein KDI82_00555 [Gammaproteobacteria bacterium]|nr:hypothetical protein [Gammaproteobacteria bacterium]
MPESACDGGIAALQHRRRIRWVGADRVRYKVIDVMGMRVAVCRSVLVILALVGLLMSACSWQAPLVQQAQSGRGSVEESPRWHIWRFRFFRADDGATHTHLDGLLADQLLFDAVLAHADEIRLWRFHRRWARDATGHQFSLMVFAPPAVARSITAGLKAAPLLKSLGEQGFLLQWRIDHMAGDAALRPSTTSDPRWPEDVQQEWPHFIMGVSRLWAGLVRAEARRHPGMDLHARYREVDAALEQFWMHGARHALLHHLNALFGYRPLLEADGSLRRY